MNIAHATESTIASKPTRSVRRVRWVVDTTEVNP